MSRYPLLGGSAGGSGGGSGPTLTTNYVAYGIASAIGGTADFQYNGAGFLTIGTGLSGTAGITFGYGVTATIQQTAPTSDIATANFNITPQPPHTGASTNVIGGNLNINLATPISGTTGSYVNVLQSGTQVVALGALPGALTKGTIWLSQTSPSSTNFFASQQISLVINSSSGNMNFDIANSQRAELSGTGFIVGGFGGYPVGATTGSNILVINVSGTNPTGGSSQSGTNGIYSDQNSLNLKNVDSAGTFTALAPASSGTTNTQARQILSFHATARLATTGTTTTLSIPLATTLTECIVTAEAHIKIASAGSLNAAGDTYTNAFDFTVKSVAGTLTIVGSSTSLDADSDTSLNTSTFVASVSGTNIVLTITATATSGTLGNADCTIYAEQVIN